MIPKIPILSRPNYYSGVSGSHYNPRSYFTRINRFTSTENQFIKASEENATIVHERVHWLQHNGTSFGCFLEALRNSQQLTTIRWLVEANPSKVSDLLNKRLNQNKPLIPIHQKHQTPIFDYNNTDESELYKQIWFDHQAVRSMFEDSRICETIGPPPGQVIGEVISDTMLGLCHNLNYSCDNKNIIIGEHASTRNWYSVHDSELTFVKYSGERLTSKMLMEAAATISEIEAISSGIWQETINENSRYEQFEKRFKQVLEGEYGAPIRILISCLSANVKIDHIFSTVNVLIYLALNPPLPPYVMAPPEGSESWHWRNLYPPLRFIQLCKSVTEIGFIRSCHDHAAIEAYMDDLLDDSGLVSTHRMDFPEYTLHSSTPHFNKWNTSKIEFHTAYPQYMDYISWTQSQLAQFRKKELPFMVDFGGCLSGDLSKKYVKELFESRKVPYLSCPLRWTDSNKVGYCCDDTFGNWLIHSNIFYESLFDIAVGHGDIDLSYLPGDIRKSEFPNWLSDTLRNHLLHS